MFGLQQQQREQKQQLKNALEKNLKNGKERREKAKLKMYDLVGRRYHIFNSASSGSLWYVFRIFLRSGMLLLLFLKF